jgi:hypothetical protein
LAIRGLRSGYTMQELDHSHIGMATSRKGRTLRRLEAATPDATWLLHCSAVDLCLLFEHSYWQFRIRSLLAEARANLSIDFREVTPRRYGQRRVARLLPQCHSTASCEPPVTGPELRVRHRCRHWPLWMVWFPVESCCVPLQAHEGCTVVQASPALVANASAYASKLSLFAHGIGGTRETPQD